MTAKEFLESKGIGKDGEDWFINTDAGPVWVSNVMEEYYRAKTTEGVVNVDRTFSPEETEKKFREGFKTSGDGV